MKRKTVIAHRTARSGYSRLTERLNRHPQGAPPSELLNSILSMLFGEEEAELVSLLPVKPFTAETASAVWKTGMTETRKKLDELAERALLVDIVREKQTYYYLPPPMAGFFEFSLMRVRDDIDQKALSELYYQYLNVEDEFITSLFATGETQLGRVFVHEPALSDENALIVLDYERSSEIIETATAIGVSTCYCRHKMSHVGKACSAPLEICLTLNDAASSLVRHGHAREIDRVEALDLLQTAYGQNLVQFGENAREEVNFLCNCCGCCCEAMIAARNFAVMNPVHTTNFLPVIHEDCTGCGRCSDVCPVEAVTVTETEDGGKRVAVLNEERCLGCGVCVRSCPNSSIHLESREKRVITPVNGSHRVVMMAIERGTLADLIFDNRALWSHRALAAVFGVILKLPPIKQVLALKQVKSRYLEKLVKKLSV